MLLLHLLEVRNILVDILVVHSIHYCFLHVHFQVIDIHDHALGPVYWSSKGYFN